MAAEVIQTLPPSTPVGVVTYLRELRPTMARMAEDRQEFIHRIGTLIEQVRQGDAAAFGRDADDIGREAASKYRYARTRVEALPVPAVCASCHEAALTWIDMLVAAADLLAELGINDDRSRLREVQSALAESRMFSNRFRGQYESLLVRLRERGTAPATKAPRKGSRLFRLGRLG